MPQPEIEALSKASAGAQVSAAVSACIAREIRAGRDRDQAIAMCHEMSRKQTGGRPAAPEGAK